MRLRIQNPNDKELSINGLRFDIEINDKDFGNGMSGQQVTVPRFSSEVVSVEVITGFLFIYSESTSQAPVSCAIGSKAPRSSCLPAVSSCRSMRRAKSTSAWVNRSSKSSMKTGTRLHYTLARRILCQHWGIERIVSEHARRGPNAATPPADNPACPSLR